MTHLEWSTFSPTRTSSSQLYSPISNQKKHSFHVHVNVTALSLTEYIKNKCIITYCSISTVNVLVRLASSFFFYVFFHLLVLHLPLTLCNHPAIFSILQQNHSSSHPSLVNTNKLSLGCPLATNFAICACTIAWRCGCCGKPSAGFHHLVWLWHFELSVDGKGADCLREKKWEIRQSSWNIWIIHSHRVFQHAYPILPRFHVF